VGIYRPFFSTDAAVADVKEMEIEIGYFNGLIANAIKFTDAGTVRISARNLPTLQQIEIQVTDTGKGIAQDKIPLIFDLFRQLDSSSTRRHGGIGLGLYLAKKHVQLLGGDLTVQSQLGKGSTFSVLLPVH
jgi:signal transduction histidine kinase